MAATNAGSAANRGFRENARGFLEGRGGDERIRRERSLRDAEEQRHAVGGLAAAVHHLRSPYEAEAIDCSSTRKSRVADADHTDAADRTLGQPLTCPCKLLDIADGSSSW
jgi:hypothetical protein